MNTNAGAQPRSSIRAAFVLSCVWRWPTDSNLPDKIAAVNRMQEYIAAHLDEEITLETLGMGADAKNGARTVVPVKAK